MTRPCPFREPLASDLPDAEARLPWEENLDGETRLMLALIFTLVVCGLALQWLLERPRALRPLVALADRTPNTEH